MGVPILVVSLSSATDRRAHVNAQFTHGHTCFEFIDAVPADLVLELFPACMPVGEHAVRLKSGLVIARTELACAASHHRALKRLIALNAPGALILEDDALLHPSFFPFHAALAAIAREWSERKLIIHCYEQFAGEREGLVLSRKSTLQVTNEISLSRVIRFGTQLWGAVGYFATNASAAALMARPPDRADAWKWFVKERNLDEVWLARPAPIKESGTLPSQLESQRATLRAMGSRSFQVRAARRASTYLSRAKELVLKSVWDPVISRIC